MCSRAVTALVAEESGRAPLDVESVRAGGRLPAVPVPLSVLAREALTDDDT